MSPEMQAALLQVVEHNQFVRVGGEKTVHVTARIVAATNAPLEEHIARGTFRLDFFYRLKEITLNLPSLRERVEDIPLLAHHFFEKQARKLNRGDLLLPDFAVAALLKHTWPGNVRELKALMGYLALRNNPVEIREILDREFQNVKKAPQNDNLRSSEVRTLLGALLSTKWNRRQAANVLGISYSSLRRRIDKYDLNRYQYKWDTDIEKFRVTEDTQ